MFASGYTIIVRKKDVDEKTLFELTKFIDVLKRIFRYPIRFTITALTGKTRVSEFNEKDFLLIEILKLIEEGKSDNEILEIIREKLEKLSN